MDFKNEGILQFRAVIISGRNERSGVVNLRLCSSIRCKINCVRNTGPNPDLLHIGLPWDLIRMPDKKNLKAGIQIFEFWHSCSVSG